MTPNFQKIPFVRHREVLGAWASVHVHIIPRILRPAVFRGLYGFEQTAYDTLIPLGSSCFTAGVLREDGHRKFSLPLDWVANGDLFVRFDFLKTRFADFFHPERMVIRVDRINHAKQRTVEATDPHIDFAFPHDFVANENGDVDTEAPRRKYERRIARLYEEARGKRCLLIFVGWKENPLHSDAVRERLAAEVLEAGRVLETAKLDLLLLCADASTPAEEVLTVIPADEHRIYVVNTPAELSADLGDKGEGLKRWFRRALRTLCECNKM